MTIVAALALAALAARQVRNAEALISHEPAETFVFGLAGLIVVPLVAILAMVTIIGVPLGLAILLMVWPAAAFAGYLMAGIWIGEWLLYRGDAAATGAAVPGLRPRADRPAGRRASSRSSVPIASLFGFGAVLLLAWRIFRAAGASRSSRRRRPSRWVSDRLVGASDRPACPTGAPAVAVAARR